MRSTILPIYLALDKNSPQQVKGSGVVIEGRRILTNAHVVQYASQIYVNSNQSANRFRPAWKRSPQEWI